MPLKRVGPRRATWHAFTQHKNYWNLYCHYMLWGCNCVFLCVALIFHLCTSCQTLSFSLVCLCLCVTWYSTEQCSARPPRQHVAGHGQTVQGNPGSVTGIGQGCEPGWLCEANVIPLGVLGVRHVLLHSTPPPLLVLLADNSLSSSFISPFFPCLFKHSLATNCSSSTF